MTGKSVKPDWRSVLRKDDRWSALVRTGSSPRSVPAGGFAFVAAPWLGEVLIKQEYRPRRAAQLGVMLSREIVRLRAAGVTAVCPVLMQEWMTTASGVMPGSIDPLDAAGWEAWAQPFLNSASSVVVPDVQGWNRCPTVWSQVSWALARNVPVHLYARRDA